MPEAFTYNNNKYVEYIILLSDDFIKYLILSYMSSVSLIFF